MRQRNTLGSDHGSENEWNPETLGKTTENRMHNAARGRKLQAATTTTKFSFYCLFFPF